MVGWADTSDGFHHAFSWTAAGGMVDLGTLPGSDYSYACAVSDGQVVGGTDISGDVKVWSRGHAVLWTEGQLLRCTGDCDGSGQVTVNELITLVNVALGNAQPTACVNGVLRSAAIDITLIIQAVNNALGTCGNG